MSMKNLKFRCQFFDIFVKTRSVPELRRIVSFGLVFSSIYGRFLEKKIDRLLGDAVIM